MGFRNSEHTGSGTTPDGITKVRVLTLTYIELFNYNHLYFKSLGFWLPKCLHRIMVVCGHICGHISGIRNFFVHWVPAKTGVVFMDGTGLMAFCREMVL